MPSSYLIHNESPQAPSIQVFLLDTMVNRGIYLGYARSNLNTKMSYDLQGKRRHLDLHNLRHTISFSKSLLNLMRSIWSRNGNVWLAMTINPDYQKSSLEIDNYLTVWVRKWVPGLFSNRYAFLTLKSFPRFPSLMFYTHTTGNLDRFKEANHAGVLQIAVTDSNSNRNTVSYMVNANEKTERSSGFFFLLAANNALIFSETEKVNFFSK